MSTEHSKGHGNGQDHGHGSHHILSDKMGWMIWVALLIGTVITVGAATVDMGRFNFFIAMVIATIKAALVVTFFMGLKWDNVENRVIFLTSLVFVGIFIVLTYTDLFFRGDVYVKGPLFAPQKGASKFQKAWMGTAELRNHGKAVYQAQCVICHGAEGKGDGAAAASLDPKPRNFTSGDGWKQGRKPSQVFNTVTKGFSKMPAFGSMSTDDRWGVVHYILSMGPAPAADSVADLKAIGIDPNQAGGGAAQEASIPVDLAIDLMSKGQ